MNFVDGVIYITYHKDNATTGMSDIYTEGFDLEGNQVFASSQLASFGGTINEMLFVDQLIFVGGNFDEADGEGRYNLTVFDSNGEIAW